MSQLQEKYIFSFFLFKVNFILLDKKKKKIVLHQATEFSLLHQTSFRPFQVFQVQESYGRTTVLPTQNSGTLVHWYTGSLEARFPSLSRVRSTLERELLSRAAAGN